LNPVEAQAARWVGVEALLQEIADDPSRFTPWLRIYLTEHRGQILGDV
jgi:isopentenyl-diphosphate delta-isomerase